MNDTNTNETYRTENNFRSQKFATKKSLGFKNLINTDNPIMEKIDRLLVSPSKTVKKTNDSLIFSIVNDDRIEKQLRQKTILEEIEKNILYSNLNIGDPQNYYGNWLNEIHNKREIDDKVKQIGNCFKMCNKLNRIHSLLINKASNG